MIQNILSYDLEQKLVIRKLKKIRPVAETCGWFVEYSIVIYQQDN